MGPRPVGPAADPDHRQRRHHGRHQQHRSQLELQPVLVEEGDRELADAEGGAAGRLVRRGQGAPDADQDRAEHHREAGDAGQQQPRIAGDAVLAHLEQHDDVDHEDHHRADVDQHLEGGDEVHAEQAVDAAEEDHGRDQRDRHAHRLAQEDHQRRRRQRRQREHRQQQRVEVAQQAVEEGGHGACPFCAGAPPAAAALAG